MLKAFGSMDLALAAGSALPAMAEDEYVPVCEAKGSNGMVTMLLCPEGLESAALADEGRIACDGRMPCGAWMWVDADAIPEQAPASHDELPKDSIQEALAIWVNETGQLIALGREKEE